MTSLRQTPTVSTGKLPSGRTIAQFLDLERRYLNEKDKLEIGERLLKAREQAGLTQQELADMLDPPVGDRSIYNYERGKGRGMFKYLRQWADITGVSYDWLLRGPEANNVSPPQRPAEDPLLAEVREVRRLVDLLLQERGVDPETGGSTDPQAGQG